MSKSTMFLNEVSVVDHAYITEHGDVRGGSFQPSFLVTGDMDPVEKVVVDFSTIKKQMKATIDDKSFGFDHKLWVIIGTSNVSAVFVDGEVINDLTTLLNNSTYGGLSQVRLVTPTTDLTLPKNAIKFIQPTDTQKDYTIENVGIWFEDYLNVEFGGEVSFKCINTINAHTTLPQDRAPIGYFTYAHGLRDSTSWGCQNIAHGHLSFIQLDTTASVEAQREVLSLITTELDGTIFIYNDNVTVQDSTDVDIRYSTGRGTFIGSYEKTSRHIPSTIIPASPAKVVILTTETTVEYLVEYICKTNASLLRSIGVTGIFVSEGLSKGAYVRL